MGNPLREFVHIEAKTVNEAVSALGQEQAWACAGGTDLLGDDEILCSARLSLRGCRSQDHIAVAGIYQRRGGNPEI